MAELEAETPASQERELDRIAAFTDGVMAIAITLLVLNIDVPRVEDARAEGLANKLLDLWRDLFAYALSFAVIGRFWVIHHRVFANLYRYDARLIALNLAFLAFLVLIPFTSDLLGDFGEEAPAAIAYAVALTGVSLLNWLIVRHTLRAGLVEPSKRHAAEPFAELFALRLPLIFALSVPVALVSTVAAELMWLLIFVAHPLVWRRYRERARR